jgi:hypothetical protein
MQAAEGGYLMYRSYHNFATKLIAVAKSALRSPIES